MSEPSRKAIVSRAYYDANLEKIKAQQAEYRRRMGKDVGAGPGRPRLERIIQNPDDPESTVTR